MGRFISFANRKGGCGKTTTAVNVAHALAMNGKKVLFVDADPQAHSTIVLGGDTKPFKKTIFDLLTEKVPLEEVIVKTHIKNLFLLPSGRDLGAFEFEFFSKRGSEGILSERLLESDSLHRRFDYLIFDPPPTAGLLAISTLVAAKEVFIPMQMHFYSMEGLAEMMRLIYKVNATYNSDLRLGGIIPTFFNPRTRLAREITAEIVKNFGEDKLLPGIRTNITLAEAPARKKSIFEYAPKSIGANDYRKLSEAILKKK